MNADISMSMDFDGAEMIKLAALAAVAIEVLPEDDELYYFAQELIETIDTELGLRDECDGCCGCED